MNGTYYQNPTFPGIDNDKEITKDNEKQQINTIDDLINNNRGKKVKVYVSYPNSTGKEYDGIIDTVGIDYIIIQDKLNNSWLLLKKQYINYIEFNEPISLII